VGSEAVTDAADVAVDTEYFLRDDERAPGDAVRIGTIRRQRDAVGGLQFKCVSHWLKPGNSSQEWKKTLASSLGRAGLEIIFSQFARSARPVARRIAIDQGARVQRMPHASNLVFDGDQHLRGIQVDDVLEAALALVVLFRDQSALEKAPVYARAIGDRDLDVMTVVCRQQCQ